MPSAAVQNRLRVPGGGGTGEPEGRGELFASDQPDVAREGGPLTAKVEVEQLLRQPCRPGASGVEHDARPHLDPAALEEVP